MSELQEIPDWVISVRLVVGAGQGDIGTKGISVPRRRRWWHIALAAGGGQQTIDWVVAESAVERIGSEQPCWECRFPAFGRLSTSMLPTRS